MFPELFTIPYVGLHIPTYGTMLVIAFLTALWLIRRLSRDITPDPQMITNAALYTLIAGIVGSRIFYVIHYWDSFRGNLLSIFAFWNGGLEQLGSILALVAILLYLLYHRLPVRKYFDIIAIALMLALAVGRIGCFLSGCCFGKPAPNIPWAVSFPYGSDAYRSQIAPDLKRNRLQPYINLPPDYFGFTDKNGNHFEGLKPYSQLTDRQKLFVKSEYRCLPVHPTQLYSSLAAASLSLLLYLFWRRNRKIATSKNSQKFLSAPGFVFALMFVFYGIGRFLIEYLRDDNPFEYGWWAIYKGGTISQNIAIYMFFTGLILLWVFRRFASKKGRS
jgi:phosphatidylglycerol---prolipoprotein diacylglyceryl transferase